VSLKLDIFSKECVSWVLTSLRDNEMIPTEKAIQSRIKEAFALKIQPNTWEILIESICGEKDQESLKFSEEDCSYIAN